jgi:hypothetical protein
VGRTANYAARSRAEDAGLQLAALHDLGVADLRRQPRLRPFDALT